MKIKQTSTKRKKLIIAGVAFLVIIGCLSFYVFAMKGELFGWKAQQDNPKTTNDINLNPPTEEEKKQGSETKQRALESDKSTRTDTPSNDTPSTLPVNITSASQSGDTLQIRVIMSTFIDNGTCTLTLTKGSQTVTKTAATRKDAHASLCLGFDVPVTELSPGQWNITVDVKANGSAGSASTTTAIN